MYCDADRTRGELALLEQAFAWTAHTTHRSLMQQRRAMLGMRLSYGYAEQTIYKASKKDTMWCKAASDFVKELNRCFFLTTLHPAI